MHLEEQNSQDILNTRLRVRAWTPDVTNQSSEAQQLTCQQTQHSIWTQPLVPQWQSLQNK